MQPGQSILTVHLVVLLTMFWITSRKLAPFSERLNLEAQRPWARRSKMVAILGLVLVVCLKTLSDLGVVAHTTQALLIFGVYSLTSVTLFWLAFQWLKAGDEFIRTVHTESLALAFVLTAMGCILLDGLVRAEILQGIGELGISLTMGYSIMISRMVVYLRYR